jgi:hypothetical protein
MTIDADGLNVAAPVWRYFMTEVQSQRKGCTTEGCVLAGEVRGQA